MKRCLSLLAVLTCSVMAQSNKAPAPTQAGRQALARAQVVRDSLVAERWNAQRSHLEERDHSQEELDRLRDSLVAAKDDRDAAQNEWRRVQSQLAASNAVSAPSPTPSAASTADPLDAVRKQLQDRLRILRERVKSGMDWDRKGREAAVDSALDEVESAPSVSKALPKAVDAWTREWSFSRTVERRQGALPRPEGAATNGTLLRIGTLGAWYASDGAVAAALLRTGSGESPWEWHEDLTPAWRKSLSDALAGHSDLLPVDPGTAPLEGPTVFEIHEHKSFLQKLALLLDFQKGPLHLLALWAARAVMVLLVCLGAAVAVISVRTRRRLASEETDADRYAATILTSFASEAGAQEMARTASDTVAGRLVRTGIANRDFSPEALEQVCISQESAEARTLEKGLGFLGSVGSNAPFIGLFGTVCGILDAFSALGHTGGGPQAVMGAIAEALVATATGLLVAIPAIWIYNSLQARAKDVMDRAKELRVLMVAASLEAAARRRG